MAKVGDVLAAPEPGWTNVDFKDSSIKYNSMTIQTSFAAGSGSVSSFSFTFIGTAVRIITGLFSDGATNVEIKIDNKVEYANFKGTNRDPHLVYEKKGLASGTHTITVRSNVTSSTPGLLTLMAIHYGTFAKVGDELDKPELGWQRHKFNEKLSDGIEAIKFYPENEWKAYQDKYIYTISQNVGYIRFKFYGSAIRIISKHFTNTATSAIITIDGEASYYNSRGEAGGDRLSFEQVGLDLGIHTVQIDTNSTGSLSLSAIDLKDGEYLVPLIKVGEALIQPEPGWTRYDDTNNQIKYLGTWSASTTDDGSYKRTVHYTSTTSVGIVSATFSFYGKSLRLIGLISPYYKKANVIIDGNILEEINFESTTNGKSILVYEKKDLLEGIHTVTIRGEKINLDAIDINGGGYLVPTVTVGDVLTQPEPGWKRFDDSHNSITYEGVWSTDTGVKNYNSTLHYKEKAVNTGPAVIKFNFYGSKLRIIGLSYYYYDTNAKIIIDGNEETINFNLSGTNSLYQCLLYEKKGLAFGQHTVQIQGIYMTLDAIDIDENGYLIAKVGDVLTQPEPGWKRFDDTDNNIKFIGNWNRGSTAKWYNGTFTNSSDVKASIEFQFYGSKLRIIGESGYSTSLHYTDLNITIDGVTETYNSITLNQSTPQSLLYENTKLTKGIHTVKIAPPNNSKSKVMNLDAIDIDADGYLFTPAKIDDVLKEPQPGWKRFDDTNPLITCAGTSWTASSGVGSKNNYNETNTFRVPSYADKTEGTVEFSFKGTGIRVISQTFTNDTWGVVNIQIDDSSENYKQARSASTYQVLLYEKTNLPPGTHTVRLTGRQLAIDAFDILDGELISVTKVGDVLKEPESGWKRFDDRDQNIRYQGNWIENENITTHYRGTFHNKPSSSGDDSIIKALFDFSGTKVRIIAFMTTGSYDVGTIKIDGEAFNFSYIKGTPTAQCLVFEKAGLEPGVHKVELSGRYINLDAIDIDDTGELIPIKIEKPKVSLYEKESGKVFVDDFDSINPKWLMSPFTAFNNVAKQGFLRMNHSKDKDSLLLIDKPQGNVAIQVIADYAPTKEGDEGGLLIYKNETNKIEFLESIKASDSLDPKEWMAVCKENQWDFYNKTDVTFDYVRSEQLEAHKIGVVLKKGIAEGFAPLDINKIIITTSNLLRLRQLYEKYKVVLKNDAEKVISTSFVEAANTGIDIPLPSLEFEGIVEIYDEDGVLVAKRQTTFFGGDMYCMGSSLHISMDTKELDEADPTHLGYMTETERLVKMTLTNDNVGLVSNVKVAIQQYMEKFGYTWAHLSLDGSNYTDELFIETLDAGSSKDFWVKIIKDVNYMAFEPIYFNIHLSHE